jgi:membrane associated rhomboid family serine protease
MFVIPLTGKISWRNPPAVTILIILINCLVYFFFQDGDRQRLYEAEQYYFNSGLAQIEIPLYVKYRSRPAGNRSASNGPPLADEDDYAQAYRQIESDAGFLYLLDKGRIVTEDNPDYAYWLHRHRIYNDMLQSVVTRRYGFRPAFPYLTTFFTYMFLHGSFGHLLGNMVFLWIVGCVLEAGCGRSLFVLVYVLGGVFAVVVYWLAYMQSTMPLVGASGAIAGLMGAYTVLFGMKKVNIFYSLGFYFNYLKVPAIILLPIWIGKEVFQLRFGTVGQVAYMAHIGGLASGALMGVLIRYFFKLSGRQAFSVDETDDHLSPLLEQALEKMGALDLEDARRLLMKVLEKEPDNLTALGHLFNIEKHAADSPRFHDVSVRLLSLLSRNGRHAQQTYNTYREYREVASHPRLSAELYLRVSAACRATGHLDQAAKILAMLIQKRPDLQGLSPALLKLANAYRQKGLARRYSQCLQAITRNFPNSPEAKIANKAIQS